MTGLSGKITKAARHMAGSGRCGARWGYGEEEKNSPVRLCTAAGECPISYLAAGALRKPLWSSQWVKGSNHQYVGWPG